jgi:hypothetical protein
MRSLESLNHAADLSSRFATSVFFEPSNKGLECVGLLSRLVICGNDSGRLRLSRRGRGRCGRRRRRSNLGCGGVVGSTLRFDALGVVGVPFLALKAGSARRSALEAISSTLSPLLDAASATTLSWLRANCGDKCAGSGSDDGSAEAVGDNGGCQSWSA